MECVIISRRGRVDIVAPRSVFAPGEVAAINSGFKCLLSDLLCFLNARVPVPTVSSAFANVGTMVAIYVRRREPRRAPAFAHVHAVVKVSKLELISVFARVRLHLGGVL